jgi:hypothetical protein
MPTDPIRPVLIYVAPEAAARELHELLVDYQAELEPGEELHTISIEPVDALRRGTVIYRVIQASRTVSAHHPDSTLYLVTEDGSRWRLPPPAL